VVHAVFIYSLFDDTASKSFCAASDYWMIVIYWTACDRKWPCPNLRHYPGIWLEG